MNRQAFVSPDGIRARFSRAMSDMHRGEVPQHGALVSGVSRRALDRDPDPKARLPRAGERERLDVERHGAIRLGTPGGLATMRRPRAVMGTVPVGCDDLSVAGVPVPSTAFRHDGALARNPSRVSTSPLRLDLIGDAAPRARAEAILDRPARTSA